MSRIYETAAGMGCLLQIIIVTIYGWIGYWSIDTITNYFGKDLHWIADVLIGLITGWASFWIALILWLIG
jgi:uncharacterized membrane protein YeaQ/YmgE (transglycosylase-associated protein family)